MKLIEAFQTIEALQKDSIVVVCQEGRVPWESLAPNLDLYIPFVGSMGKGSSLALGIALARPDRRVVVVDGDGSLLMNLGSLVTIAGKSPKNLCHMVVENGIYAGTGGQPVPNAGQTSFTGMAKAAGYVATYEFDDLEEFSIKAPEAMYAEGPVFVSLKVDPEPEMRPMATRPRGRPMRQGIYTVRDTLAAS
jgi:phosphonopyruvate decarboxylase